ncbi:MAG: helix-turn-helix domain-containing protein [Gammaproteobacteria bacterium]
MPRTIALTKGATFSAFAGTLVSLGVPLSGYLRRARLPSHFDEMPDAWVSYGAMREFLDAVCRREGLDDLGQRVTQRMALQGLHPVLRGAIGASPTLYVGISRIARLAQFQSTHLRMWMEPHADTVRLCHKKLLGPEVPGYDITEAYTTHVFVSLFRQFCGREWLPQRVYSRRLAAEGVRGQHATPLTQDGVRLVLHDDYAGFDVPAEVLITPNPTVESIERPVDLAGPPTALTESLLGILGPYLMDGTPSIDTVAAIFGLSRRTLQRKLKEENSTYARVLSQARFERAKGELADLDRPLTDIALRVGYSEQSAFNRAFRSWTGIAPGAYRELLLARGTA